MKPIDARIKDGKFEFSLAAVLNHPEGTTFRIVPADNRPTAKLHRFLRVCVKYYFYQHPFANWKNPKETWLALKLEIPELHNVVWTLKGTREKAVISIAGYSKRRLQPVVDAVLRHMDEQGLDTPDSKHFKDWEDSAPPAGEEYPPLARIIEAYERERKSERIQTRSGGAEGPVA